MKLANSSAEFRRLLEAIACFAFKTESFLCCPPDKQKLHAVRNMNRGTNNHHQYDRQTIVDPASAWYVPYCLAGMVMLLAP